MRTRILQIKLLFFNNFFPKLAGTNDLQQQIENGVSEEDIRKSWEPGLQRFKNIRKKIPVILNRFQCLRFFKVSIGIRGLLQGCVPEILRLILE